MANHNVTFENKHEALKLERYELSMKHIGYKYLQEEEPNKEFEI